MHRPRASRRPSRRSALSRSRLAPDNRCRHRARPQSDRDTNPVAAPPVQPGPGRELNLALRVRLRGRQPALARSRDGAPTRWCGQIAPPLYVITAGRNVTKPFVDEEMKQRFRGLFRGVGKYFSGSEWEFYLPIRPGVQLYHSGLTTIAVDVRESSFSGGRSVVETLRTVYATADGLPVAACHETLISAERGGSRNTGKHADIKRQVYTPADIEAIDETTPPSIAAGRIRSCGKTSRTDRTSVTSSRVR